MLNIMSKYIKYKEEWSEFFEDNNVEKILDDALKDTVYPKKKNIFKIFKYLEPSEIKVVLLGQDPYIGSEIHSDKDIPQAMGLSFSVPSTHKIPPSLKNIFKEINNSYPEIDFKHGNLKKWVKREKIFLLNSALTVIPKRSNSHQKLWKDFTDNVIKYLSDTQENIIFLLMGNNAISKKQLIDVKKHIVFTTVHPSPLSASRGFFGCDVFKKINEKLVSLGREEINWQN